MLYVALESAGTHDIVALDLTSFPVTPSIVIADSSAPLERAGWAFGRDRSEILLVGGLGSDLVHRLDLSTGVPTELEELPSRAPIQIAGPMVTWDRTSARYLVGYGLTGLDTIVDQMWWYDPVAGTFDDFDASAGPTGSFYGWLGEIGSRLLFAIGGRPRVLADLWELRP